MVEDAKIKMLLKPFFQERMLTVQGSGAHPEFSLIFPPLKIKFSLILIIENVA